MKKFLLLAFFLLPSISYAQVVDNPNAVNFGYSETAGPLVSYQIEVWNTGSVPSDTAMTAFLSPDIPKAAAIVQPDGSLNIPASSWGLTIPQSSNIYFATILTKGSGGKTRSVATNTFRIPIPVIIILPPAAVTAPKMVGAPVVGGGGK